MVTKCIREPYMILGPFLMLFQTVPLGCSASDTITHTIVGTFTVTFAPSEPRPNTLESLTHDWDCFVDAIQTFPNLVVIILVKYGVSL